LIEHDKEVGFELIMADDIDDLGTDEIIKHIRQRIGDSPVYLRYVKVSSKCIADTNVQSRPALALTLTPSVCSQLIAKYWVLISLLVDPGQAPASERNCSEIALRLLTPR
jgi:hypothetical protein